MNLLRKNLENQDMAKRVKKLIRKWKQEIDKIKQNGIANEPANRLSTPSPSSENMQAGLKRKININQYNNMNGKRQDLKQRTSSPRVPSPNIQRVQQTSSPVRNRTKSPHPSGSPKVLPKDRINPRSSPSPKLANNSHSSSPTLSPASNKIARNTPSPLVTSNHTDTKPVKCESNVDSKVKKNGNHNGFHEGVNLKSIDKKEQIESIITKDCDTRIQEDRISSIDSGYQGTLSDEHSPTDLSQDEKKFQPIDKPPDESIIPDSFEPIDEEELAVERKDFSEDPSSPSITADGVNGTYDPNGEFCNWTDEISHGEFSVLPYIILD